MPCSPDLPAWINAASVVALAAITAWYAHSTRDLVRVVREEREERARELRRPVATLLDEIERDLAASRAMPAATTFMTEMDNIAPGLRRSHERVEVIADLYRDAPNVYIANFGGCVQRCFASRTMSRQRWATYAQVAIVKTTAKD